MAKRKLPEIEPDFSREAHFARGAIETTPSGIDTIYSSIQKISKNILKDTLSGKNKDILDGAYGRRREAAIRRTLPDIITEAQCCGIGRVVWCKYRPCTAEVD